MSRGRQIGILFLANKLALVIVIDLLKSLHPQSYGPSGTQVGGGATFAASGTAHQLKNQISQSRQTEWASKTDTCRRVEHLLAGRRSKTFFPFRSLRSPPPEIRLAWPELTAARSHFH